MLITGKKFLFGLFAITVMILLFLVNITSYMFSQFESVLGKNLNPASNKNISIDRPFVI